MAIVEWVCPKCKSPGLVDYRNTHIICGVCNKKSPLKSLLDQIKDKREDLIKIFDKYIADNKDGDKYQHMLSNIWEQDQETFLVAEALGMEWDDFIEQEDNEGHDEIQEHYQKLFNERWVAAGLPIEDLQ